jgi:antitoxin component YwqK of YwqJK toxin-antitoxin module
MEAARKKDKTNREHASEAAKKIKVLSDAQNVPVKIYYDSGVLKEEGAGTFTKISSVTGKTYEWIGLEGSYKTYFENGMLESDFNYFNKQPAGIAKMYYPSGNVSAEIIWVNDWVYGCCSGPTHGVVRGVRIFDETGKKISWNY